MNKTRLLSTVAATLLLTVGAASAQNVKKDEAPAPAPAAQQSAPAEKIAPAMKPGAQNVEKQKAPETTGQAPSDATKTPATEKGAMDKGGAEKPMEKKSMDKKMDKGAAKPNANDNAEEKTRANKENTAQDNMKSKSGRTGEKGATTGQGAAGAGKLSTEQRTQITTIIRQHKVAPVKLNVSVRVGTRVPQNVHFNRLPSEVYVIYPQWRGYDYILVGDEIVVIDPRTHEIVAILEA